MKKGFILLLLAIVPCLIFAQAEINPETGQVPEWETFAPGVISLPDIRETSPSITADGQTLVFARTQNWKDKVPYIAQWVDGTWQVEKAPFVDTVYNLAISPDGQTIFIKKYEKRGEGEDDISHVYRVDRTASGWSEMKEIKSLYNINAGYFCPMASGRLYFYARGHLEKGIYYADPLGNGDYGPPVWLSDEVSTSEVSTSFDVYINVEEDRLFITKSGGEDFDRGFYFYEKTASGWNQRKKLDNLPYGWGMTVLPGERVLFVDAGDLQVMPLAKLKVDWSQPE